MSLSDFTASSLEDYPFIQELEIQKASGAGDAEGGAGTQPALVWHAPVSVLSAASKPTKQLLL